MKGLDDFAQADFKRQMLPFFNSKPTDNIPLTGPNPSCIATTT